MISSIGAQQPPSNIYATQAKQSTRPPGVPAGAKEAFAIDLDKLFTPSERKTIENMKSYAKSEGMSDRDIEMMEGDIIAAKHAEKTISHDIPIKEILSRQIRGIEDGYGNENSLSLDFLRNLYENFNQFKGTELFA